MSRMNILTDDNASNQFIEACLALKDQPIANSPYSLYDYFPHWHFQAMNSMTPANNTNVTGRNAAHGGPSFGPWHRLMLLVFESLASQVLDTDFELPYWDWAADSTNTSDSPLWDIIGGNGVASNNFNVNSGPFREGQFTVSLTDSLTPGQWTGVNPPRPLQRRFNNQESPTSRGEINQIISNFGFYDRQPYDNRVSSFRLELETTMHNTIHRFVGGDMLTSASPNDPIFFLHHCNIDRIWAAWQTEYPNVDYVPRDSASDNLNMHRFSDTMHNFFNINLPISAMVSYENYYNYDSLN